MTGAALGHPHPNAWEPSNKNMTNYCAVTSIDDSICVENGKSWNTFYPVKHASFFVFLTSTFSQTNIGKYFLVGNFTSPTVLNLDTI